MANIRSIVSTWAVLSTRQPIFVEPEGGNGGFMREDYGMCGIEHCRRK